MLRDVVSDAYRNVIEALRTVTLWLEKGLNLVFTQKYNPLYYHGALPNFFLWVLYLSGLLLFAYYVPTLEGAYNSVNYITSRIPSGALFRATHRYAADAMMIFVLVHFFRVLFTDRYREYRILPWITGVLLITVMFIAGLTGYMLIWDADSVALTFRTMELLNAIPVIGPPVTALLIGGQQITDYTLTRYMFLHFAIPSSMLFFLWWHYLRITRPVTNAPLALNLLMFGGLLMFCGIFPVAIGQAPPVNLSDMAFIPQAIKDVDWLYMFPQGFLVTGKTIGFAWLVTLGIPLGMLLLPYVQSKQFVGQFAQVVSDNCTGCSLCYHDCPYEAIEMHDRDDNTKFKRIAVVDVGRCANCGLCVGACAFKAIEIPRSQTPNVFAEIEAAMARAEAAPV